MHSFIWSWIAVLVCLAGPWADAASAADRQAAKGRIDVIAKGGAFELAQPTGSAKARVSRCPWLGKAKERTGVSCEKRLGKEWEEIWVAFVATADGEVTIDLQGEWYPKESDRDIRLVWVDNVSVEGATIRNGDFEQADARGRPVGWTITGKFPPDRYSRDGSVARSGSNCVAVWHSAQARQAFRVRKGKAYRVRGWFRVLDPGRATGARRLKFDFPAETYRQEVRIEFKTAAAAGKASVEIAPLFNDYRWAISSRWDDNNRADLKMRDVLARHGQKGTWYLNWGKDFAPTGRKLLQGGNSIGGHSLSHPMLTYVNRNRIFEEVAGVRMEWEAAADTRVLSYAFSFCDFRNDLEGDAVQADITRALERAGYYNIANGWYHDGLLETDMILSPIMPWDGADIDDFAQGALANESFRAGHPNLSHAMHVWYRTPVAWAKFEAQLDKYGGRDNWWYCNQNQYAAYRYQFGRTRLGKLAREGKVLRVRLERPLAADLNDPTPLTLRVVGAGREDVQSVRCATADWAPSDRPGREYLFHLSHDRDQKLPERIGIVRNRDNRSALTRDDRDADFPDLRALLHFADGQVRLLLSNEGPRPLTGVRVTYRMPLAWTEGVVRRRIADVPPGQKVADAITPTPAAQDYRLTAGTGLFAAQVDFLRGDEPARLHLTCHVRGPSRDDTYPQGGFSRLGPIPTGQFDLAQWADTIRRGGPGTDPLTLPGGKQLTWTTDDGPARKPYLSPEVIRTTGNWYNTKQHYYVLQTDLHSPRAQTVGIRCVAESLPGIFVNGAKVTGRQAKLRRGANRLVLIYRTSGRRYRGEHAGCFFRLTKPGSSERVPNVRYQPVLPPGEKKS